MWSELQAHIWPIITVQPYCHTSAANSSSPSWLGGSNVLIADYWKALIIIIIITGWVCGSDPLRWKITVCSIRKGRQHCRILIHQFTFYLRWHHSLFSHWLFVLLFWSICSFNRVAKLDNTGWNKANCECLLLIKTISEHQAARWLVPKFNILWRGVLPVSLSLSVMCFLAQQ